MSQVWPQSLAIARSGWLAMYNRGWRFSPRKALAIGLVSELAVIFWIGRRAGLGSGQLGPNGLTGVLALLLVQMGWFGLMYGFGRGQFQLYTGILVPLFQITPARPISLLLGRVIEALPRRSWSTLLWAWAYGQLLPARERLYGVVALAAAGIAVSALMHLSGLLAVTLWSRYSPKSLRRGLFVMFALSLAGVTWATIYLSTGGGNLAGLAAAMRSARWYLFGAMGILGGVPGLSLLLAFVFQPAAVENLYQVSVHRVLELAEREDTRPRRSTWLPLSDGPFRAVVNREWLSLTRASGTRFRLALAAAGLVGVWAAAPAAAGKGLEVALLVVVPVALVTWWIAFGNMATGAFVGEGRTLPIYRLTSVGAAPVLAGKLAALAVPALALAAAATLLGAWRAGLGIGSGLQLLLWLAGAMTAAAAAGLGVAAATVPDADDEEEAAAATAGGGMAGGGAGLLSWATVRMVALVVPLLIGSAAGAGDRSPVPVISAGLGAALLVIWPAACLVVGAQLLAREWTAGGPRRPHRRRRPQRRPAGAAAPGQAGPR